MKVSTFISLWTIIPTKAMRQACENAKMQRFSTKKEFLYSTTLSLNLFISAVLFLRNTSCKSRSFSSTSAGTSSLKCLLWSTAPSCGKELKKTKQIYILISGIKHMLHLYNSLILFNLLKSCFKKKSAQKWTQQRYNYFADVIQDIFIKRRLFFSMHLDGVDNFKNVY